MVCMACDHSQVSSRAVLLQQARHPRHQQQRHAAQRVGLSLCVDGMQGSHWVHPCETVAQRTGGIQLQTLGRSQGWHNLRVCM
jgi:hypothetical protein